MNNKVTVSLAIAAAVAGIALLGWQGWNTQRLEQQVTQLQQQLDAQSIPAGGGLAQNAQPLPRAFAAPGTHNAPSQQNGVQQSPSANDPFWGDDDPFADMQRMQQQMHQHMQQLLAGAGLGKAGSSLFDLDPFQGGSGFASSMGFGAGPDFSFKENGDHYEIAVGIPQGSNVELNTSVHGRDLTVEGKVSIDRQNSGNGSNVRSMQTQQFARTLQLPTDADPLGISTRTDKDKVVVTVAKLAKNKQPLSMAPSSGKSVL